MNILLEKFNVDLFKRSEIEGREPVVLSSVLLPEQKMQRRESDITKFFGEKESGFTYKKFKSVITPSIDGIFKLGADAKKKIQTFATSKTIRTEKGETLAEYDEYIETFFMYLYYQIFVRLLTNQDLILSKNKEAISNATTILQAVPEPLKPDVEENLVNMYKAFYAMFGSSIADPQKMGQSQDEREQYFENFANQNVGLFTTYPISSAMKGESFDGVKPFMDAMFDAIKGIGFGTGNRQIASIGLLSEFIDGTSVEFDVVKFQNSMKDYPAISDQARVKFPTSVEASISDVLTELSSIDDLDSIGMDWATNTQWAPYIKMMCGIVSMEGISNKVKAASKAMRKQKSTYKKVFDPGEQDGGVFFVNNQAFIAAAERVPRFKNVVQDLNTVIGKMSKKASYFQTKDGNQLIEAMFVKYDPSAAAEYIESLGDERASLEAIMELTDLMGNFGGNFLGAVADINYIFFTQNNVLKGNPNKRNVDAIEYAKTNVGDYVIEKISKRELDYFSPSSVSTGIKEMSSATVEAFSKIFKGDFTIDNVIDSFNKTFSDQLNFARAEQSGSQFVIRMGPNDKIVYRFDDIESIKDYVKNMSTSMGSMLYHSKVAFGASGTRDSRYESYFNVLSWFIKSLDESGAAEGVATKQYPFVYLVTPFLLEVIKYSFRTFVNEIQDVLLENGMIDKELANKIKDSHEMDAMDDEEWRPLVDSLADAIEEYLKTEKK